MPGTAFFEVAAAACTNLADSARPPMLTGLTISSPKILTPGYDSLECSVEHLTGRIVVSSPGEGFLMTPLQQLSFSTCGWMKSKHFNLFKAKLGVARESLIRHRKAECCEVPMQVTAEQHTWQQLQQNVNVLQGSARPSMSQPRHPAARRPISASATPLQSSPPRSLGP